MRKFVKKLLIALLGLTVILTVWVLANSVDAPEAEDADLMVASFGLPDGENAYAYLEKIEEKLKLEKNDSDVDKTRKLLREGPKNFTVAKQQLLDKNKQALTAWRRTMDMNKLEFPRIDPYTYAPTVNYVPYVHIARLASLQAAYYLSQGDKTSALREALRIVDFGSFIQGGRKAYLMGYVIGQAIQTIGLHRIQAIIASVEITPLEGRRIIKRLEHQNARNSAFSRVWKDEYDTQLQLIENMLAANPVAGDTFLVSIQRMPYFLHPNRTRSIAAQEYRALSQQAIRPCNEMQFSQEQYVPWYEWFRPNGTGRVAFAYLGSSNYESYFMRKCLVNFYFSATQTLVGLKAHRSRNGTLPNTLNELVPVYLLYVPSDDFDARPIRYSKQRKWLYSVGSNYKDEGGKLSAVRTDLRCSGDQPDCLLEPTVPIPF
ncbi:MAG: hypothetical protein OES46_02545 [Gammaproteobacteria bacterium]|nr:hypothetical protein [Gammaproteobacteria bacterium]